MIQYPRQIFCEWGNKSQVNAEFHLTPARESAGEPPMVMHAGALSRFAITVLDMTDGSTKALSANIPWDNVAFIREKTRRAGILMDMYDMKHTADEETEASGSSAYSVKIGLGYFKGKTPAEVLLENPAEKDRLLQTKEFLEKNADKYPANRKQITAIEEAINMLEAGTLKDGTAVSAASKDCYVVYEKQFKNKKPYYDGKRTIYSIKIECQFGQKYPWKITVSNCVAPMKPFTKGQILPDMSRAENKKTGTIRLSDEAWIECADIMYRRLLVFENEEYPKARKRMLEAAWSPDKEAFEDSSARITETPDGITIEA